MSGRVSHVCVCQLNGNEMSGFLDIIQSDRVIKCVLDGCGGNRKSNCFTNARMCGDAMCACVWECCEERMVRETHTYLAIHCSIRTRATLKLKYIGGVWRGFILYFLLGFHRGAARTFAAASAGSGIIEMSSNYRRTTHVLAAAAASACGWETFFLLILSFLVFFSHKCCPLQYTKW